MLPPIPGDVIIAIMEYLSQRDLASLALTSHDMYHLVEEFGWKNFLRLNPRPFHSFTQSFKSWSARDQVQLRATTDRNWARQEFVARPLSQRWSHKLQPLLAINSSRLILAAGTSIYTYGFHSAPSSLQSAPVQLECTYSTNALHPNRDITALVTVPGGGADADRTVFVGYADGALERLVLADCSSSRDSSSTIKASWERYNLQNGLIEGLSVSRSHLLSVSSGGVASLLSLDPAERTHGAIDLDNRSWCCYLSLQSSSPFAAFGITAPHAIPIFNVLPSQLAAQPSLYLDAESPISTVSGVYAITSSPPSSPWGSSDQVLVSGWYDGVVRVHDLRSSSRLASEANQPPRLLPVLTLEDPWSREPIYSVCSGGGSGAHVVAGSARHSVVAFWDVRTAKRGWSVHAPGNDASPVYAVVTDGPRVFGAHESRGFVLDFGGGVDEDTYPHITTEVAPSRRGNRWSSRTGDDTLKKEPQNRAGFYVTKYAHGKY